MNNCDLDHHFPHDSADALGCWALMLLCGMVLYIFIDFPFLFLINEKEKEGRAHAICLLPPVIIE